MRAGETALTPIGSRKGSPVQNRPVRDSPLRVAGDTESQFFACARYVRRTFPYRLTCDLVANLRLLFRERRTAFSLRLTDRSKPAHNRLYACTGKAGQAIGTASKVRTDARIRRMSDQIRHGLCVFRCPSPPGFDSPGAHCTVHHRHRLPKILTLDPHSPGGRSVANARRARDRPFAPPVNPHLTDKNAAKADIRTTPEKPHRNLRGFKKPNALRYLARFPDGRPNAASPRKASPIHSGHSYDSRVTSPEKSHLCQKNACENGLTIQYRRGFQRKWTLTAPEKPHH